jgi:hypothetical protein
MVVFAKGVPYEPIWFSFAYGAKIIVFDNKNSIITSSGIDTQIVYETFGLYISNENDLVMIDYDHGALYQIFRYQDGVLENIARFGDGSYGDAWMEDDYCYYVNDEPRNAAQFAEAFDSFGIVCLELDEKYGYFNDIDYENSFVAIISGRDVLGEDYPGIEIKDDTEKSLGALKNEPSQKAQIDIDIDKAISRIQAAWRADTAAISKGSYETVDLGGVNIYIVIDPSHNLSPVDKLKRVEIAKNTDDITYSRIYQYENGNLTFAYIEGDDSHRLYFKDNMLIRWRHTPDIRNPSEWTDYECDWDSRDYNRWREFAIDEGYKSIKYAYYNDFY